MNEAASSKRCERDILTEAYMVKKATRGGWWVSTYWSSCHAWIWSCFNSIQVQDSPPKSTVFTVHPSFLIPPPPSPIPQFQILQSYIAALHSLYVPEGCQWGGNSILTNLTQFVERFPGCPSCAPWNIALLPRDPRKHCPLVAPGILGILGFHILAAARLELDCSDPAIWCLCKKIGIKW